MDWKGVRAIYTEWAKSRYTVIIYILYTVYLLLAHLVAWDREGWKALRKPSTPTSRESWTEVKKGLEVGWTVTTKGNFFRVCSVKIATGCPKRRHCVTVYQTTCH